MFNQNKSTSSDIRKLLSNQLAKFDSMENNTQKDSITSLQAQLINQIQKRSESQ